MLKCAFMVEYSLPSHCACRTGIKRWDQTDASWNGTDQERTRCLASQEEAARALRVVLMKAKVPREKLRELLVVA